MKYSFCNDYSEGTHPKILEALTQNNDSQETGYGEDRFSMEAQALIRNACGRQDVDVHFVSGGTQANMIALASMLESYESVIAAATGHIAIHEAGAIEATGHKIHTVDCSGGKLTVEDIDPVISLHASDEHMVKTKAIFISQPTELGTVYSKSEIQTLSSYAKEHDLYLYVDGARLPSALASEANDVTLDDIAELTDMFYIGGTKNGALIGEAIIICNPELQPHFRRHMKQRGALLAKGRLFGLQFKTLFTDGLYLELARQANAMAQKLSEGIAGLGFRFLTDSPTNQIFPILPDKVISILQADYSFYVWSKVDTDHSSIRLVTSWATKQEHVEMFLADLKLLSKN